MSTHMSERKKPRKGDRHTGRAVTIRLSEDLHREIEQMAEATDRSVSQMIRHLLRIALEQSGHPPNKKAN